MSESSIFGLERFENAGLERLEDRLLLAVSFNQAGNTLTITGNNAQDVIEIHSVATGVGVYFDTDGNGIVDDYVYYAGVDNIFVNSGGGNDTVRFSYLSIDGNLTINTAGGNDTVYGGYAAFTSANLYYGANYIGGNLSVNTGTQNDSVRIGDTDVYGRLTANTGAGNDHVEVFSYFSDVYVAGPTVIVTLDGDDDVSITSRGGYDLYFHSDVTINTVNQNDKVTIGAPRGNGDVFIYGNVWIDTGAGNDMVTLYGYGESKVYSYSDAELDIYGQLTIKTGNDHDKVFIYDDVQVYGNTLIDLGKGNDRAHVDGEYDAQTYFYGTFSLIGSDGMDAVKLYDYVTFHGNASFNGGGAFDYFYDSAPVFHGTRTVTAFEFVI